MGNECKCRKVLQFSVGRELNNFVLLVICGFNYSLMFIIFFLFYLGFSEIAVSEIASLSVVQLVSQPASQSVSQPVCHPVS